MLPQRQLNRETPSFSLQNGQFYLDYQEDKNSVRNIYNFNPAIEGLTSEQQALVKGVQGNIWCEWIPSRERMQYMAVPRLLAIAELGLEPTLTKELE